VPPRTLFNLVVFIYFQTRHTSIAVHVLYLQAVSLVVHIRVFTWQTLKSILTFDYKLDLVADVNAVSVTVADAFIFARVIVTGPRKPHRLVTFIEVSAHRDQKQVQDSQSVWGFFSKVGILKFMDFFANFSSPSCVFKLLGATLTFASSTLVFVVINRPGWGAVDSAWSWRLHWSSSPPTAVQSTWPVISTSNSTLLTVRMHR